VVEKDKNCNSNLLLKLDDWCTAGEGLKDLGCKGLSYLDEIEVGE
jgi:hypothetical protein